MTPDERAAVVLPGMPLDLWLRADEHTAELAREFELLALAGPPTGVPARLAALRAELLKRYAAEREQGVAQRDAALARGERSLDLRYDMPRHAAQAARELDATLDEADVYCRESGRLLTLAASPDVVAFRKWYLGEVVAQLEGAAPVPWPESSYAQALSRRS